MAFNPDDTVLVTGANGHVGSHLVNYLLNIIDNGPVVRAAVRSESSESGLREVFGKAIENGRLTFVQVKDITAKGAFDDALVGVTYVAHIASPLVLSPDDVERDLLQPAIRGTVGLLESARNSSSIKAIVVTSSFAAAFDPIRGWKSEHVYTSADWSPLTYEQGAGRQKVEGLDPRYEGFVSYLSSKALAEKAAWDFYNEAVKEPGVKWRFATVLPTYIGGPCVLPLRGETGTDGYSFSQKKVVDLAIAKTNKGTVDDFPLWIDVRDVARAHAQALILPDASGQRWILACQKAKSWQIAASIQTNFPKLGVEVERETDTCFDVSTESSLEGLQLGEWIGLDQMVFDTISPVAGRL